MQFEIMKTWNSRNLDHQPVRLSFKTAKDGLEIGVKAPFFNDPGNPGGEPGQPFQNLWDYEGNACTFISKMKEPSLTVLNRV